MFNDQQEENKVPLFRIHIPLPKDKKPVNFEELYNMTQKLFQKEINKTKSPKKPSEGSSETIEKCVETDDQLQNKIKQQGLTKFEQTLLDIERRERNMKNSIVTSASSNEKVKSAPSKGDAYDSDDSFIDDAEYDDYIIRQDGKDSFGEEIMGFEDDESVDEEKDENDEGGVSDSEDEGHGKSTGGSGTTDENVTFLPEMEKALEDLTKKSVEENLGVLRKIPDTFEQNLVFIADLRQKLYPRGWPKTLYEKMQKILNCPMQTLKNKLKKVLEDNSLVDIKKQIKDKYEELKKSVRDDIIAGLKKKINKTTTTTTTTDLAPVLPISDVEKMDHERLVEYAKTQKGLTVLWCENTKKLFLNSVEILLSSLQKEKDFTGKDFDKEKELSKFFKEIEHYWPAKNLDLKKKYKKFTDPELEKKKDDSDKKRKKEESPKEEKKKKKKLETVSTPSTTPSSSTTPITSPSDKKMIPQYSPHQMISPSQQQQMFNFKAMPQMPQNFNTLKPSIPIGHLNYSSLPPVQSQPQFLKTFTPNQQQKKTIQMHPGTEDKKKVDCDLTFDDPE
eukprot:gene9313-1401_t